ncbi:DUF432 domain-containing protein [Pyrodictium delaneyi]|nr:DUF432 domain-containing protein [Pyrodictium delaneyi]
MRRVVRGSYIASSTGPRRGTGLQEEAPPGARLVLEPGGELTFGRIRARLGSDGSLEACDDYGCIKARVPHGSSVFMDPVPPLNRPSRISNCLYIEFEEQLIVPGGRSSFWTTAPYEFMVHVNGIVLGYLSPLRVKYTLIGDIVDGVVCRYHRAIVTSSHRELTAGGGLGLVSVRFRGSPGKVPGIGFYAAGAPLFTNGSFVYYPEIEAEVDQLRLSVRATQRPPLSGLREARRARLRAGGLLPQVFVVTLEGA